MTISICLPTVRPGTVGFAIAAILQQSWPDWELLVVGQGSAESALRATVESASGGDPRVRYIHLGRTGLSIARNVAVAETSGGVIAFTDDDCEPARDWLAVIAGCFEEDPDLGLVGGAVRRPPGGPRGWLTTCPTNEPAEVRYEPVPGTTRHPDGWDWIGANFALRRSVVERVGPFDESLGAGTDFPSGEDTDYKFRLEALGIVMLTSPRSVVDHTYGARSGVRAGLRHSRNYARGNAALAAKLTLQGDPFGEEWRSRAMWGTTQELRRDLLPHRIPVALSRRWHFERSYRQCLAGFTAEPGGVLALVDSEPQEEAHRRAEGSGPR